MAEQEQRFRQAGAAARDYGNDVVQRLAGARDAAAGFGQAAGSVEQRWRDAWGALDSAAETALARTTRRFGRAVADMIVDGDSLRNFWRALWSDLVEIAVQRLVRMVLETRAAGAAMRDALNIGGGLFGGGWIGGVFGAVGNLFGGVGKWLGFDNPAHDAWARRQGFDFGRHFRAGVNAAMASPLRTPASLGPALASAGMGSIAGSGLRAASIAPGAFQVTINAQTLDERTVRDAGGVLADEVSRRLGWSDRRSGL